MNTCPCGSRREGIKPSQSETMGKMQGKRIGWIYKDEAAYLTFIKEKFKLAQKQNSGRHFHITITGFQQLSTCGKSCFIFNSHPSTLQTSLVAQTVKCMPTMQETRVQSLGGEDPLEKEMATHSSTLAWKMPWEEPGRLQSMGS